MVLKKEEGQQQAVIQFCLLGKSDPAGSGSLWSLATWRISAMQKRVNHALHVIRAGQVADSGNHNSRPMAALISRCSIHVTQAAKYQSSAHVDLIQNDCCIGKSGRVREAMIAFCMSVCMPVHPQPLGIPV